LPCLHEASFETREQSVSLRSRFFVATYNRQMGRTEKAGLTDMRRRLLAEASGDVLEIGSGTGANLPTTLPRWSR
jgi:hypothetical protein